MAGGKSEVAPPQQQPPHQPPPLSGAVPPFAAGLPGTDASLHSLAQDQHQVSLVGTCAPPTTCAPTVTSLASSRSVVSPTRNPAARSAAVSEYSTQNLDVPSHARESLQVCGLPPSPRPPHPSPRQAHAEHLKDILTQGETYWAHQHPSLIAREADASPLSSAGDASKVSLASPQHQHQQHQHQHQPEQRPPQQRQHQQQQPQQQHQLEHQSQRPAYSTGGGDSVRRPRRTVSPPQPTRCVCTNTAHFTPPPTTEPTPSAAGLAAPSAHPRAPATASAQAARTASSLCHPSPHPPCRPRRASTGNNNSSRSSSKGAAAPVVARRWSAATAATPPKASVPWHGSSSSLSGPPRPLSPRQRRGTSCSRSTPASPTSLARSATLARRRPKRSTSAGGRTPGSRLRGAGLPACRRPSRGASPLPRTPPTTR